MAKPNYSFQKRQRELQKKQKKEQKLQQKMAEKMKPDEGVTPEPGMAVRSCALMGFPRPSSSWRTERLFRNNGATLGGVRVLPVRAPPRLLYSTGGYTAPTMHLRISLQAFDFYTD